MQNTLNLNEASINDQNENKDPSTLDDCMAMGEATDIIINQYRDDKRGTQQTMESRDPSISARRPKEVSSVGAILMTTPTQNQRGQDIAGMYKHLFESDL